jgi:hypothetical protein
MPEGSRGDNEVATTVESTTTTPVNDRGTLRIHTSQVEANTTFHTTNVGEIAADSRFDYATQWWGTPSSPQWPEGQTAASPLGDYGYGYAVHVNEEPQTDCPADASGIVDSFTYPEPDATWTSPSLPYW